MTSPYSGDGDYSRTASVQLNADLGNYPQEMAAATTQTNSLADSVDRLEHKIGSLTRTAGKKLVHFSAADFAVLSGASADAATFEHQLGTLNATAAITPLSMRGVKAGIENAFTTLPASRTQIVGLATDLTNLGVTGSRDIGQLVTTFLKLSAATGEPVEGLAQGLIQLSRLMGTTNATQIGNYANAVLTVSKNSGVSATGVLNFAQAIAPMARQAGIGEAAVLGISAAFSKAGADGYVAANTFNSIVGDITQLTQSGSPELAKYANLIGVTVSQFKGMDKTTALVDIFNTISRQGPQAINTLNRLGIDGVRAQSAIAAVVQSGGLDKAISSAQGSSGNQNNLNKASKAAWNDTASGLELVRNQLTQFGTEIGSTFLKPLTLMTHGLSDVLHIVNLILKPFSALIGIIGGMAGVFTALGGGALLAAGAMGKLLAVGLVARSSPIAAFRGGRAFGRTGTENEASRMAAGEGTGRRASLGWWQRPFYNLGNRMGQGQGEGGGSAFTRGLALPVRGGAYLMNAQRAYVDDIGRAGLDRRSPLLTGMGTGTAFLRQAARHPVEAFRGGRAAGAETTEYAAATRNAAKGVEGAAAAQVAAGARVAEAAGATATSQNLLARQSGALVGAFVKLEAATVRAGAKTAVAGVGAAGRGLFGALGGPVGAAFIGLPLALMAEHAISAKADKQNLQTTDYLNPLKALNDQLGIATTNLADFSQTVATADNSLSSKIPANVSLQQAAGVTQSDVSTFGGMKVTDKAIGALAKTAPHDIRAGIALAQSYHMTDNRTAAAFKGQLLAAGYTPDEVSSIMKGATAGGTKLDTGGGDLNYLAGKIGGTEGKGVFARNASTSGAVLSQSVFSGIGQQFNLDSQSHSVGFARTKQFQSALSVLTTLGRAVQQDPDNSAKQKALAAAIGTLTGASKSDIRQYANIISNAATADPGGGNALSKSSGIYKILNSYVGAGKSYLANVRGAGGSTDVGTLSQWLAAQSNAAPTMSAYATNVRGSGALGRFAQGNAGIQAAYNAPQDPAQQYGAMTALYRQAGGGSQASPEKVSAAFDALTGAIKDTSDQLYIMARSAKAYAQQQEQYALPYESRRQQLTQSSKDYQQAYRANMDTPTADTAGDLQKAQSAYEQQKAGYQQYMLSVYQTAQQYGTQMVRAQEDQDTQIYRAHRDFFIQMNQSQEDYNKQTYRAQRDFNIQMQQQAESAAQNIYNPYERVQAKYTLSASTLLQNLQNQNQRLVDQQAQLKHLTAMGVSQKAIQTLDLANPTNSQQLTELVSNIAQNPQLVAEINKTVGSRISATTKLTQSTYNLAFTQTVENFKRGLSDTAKDYDIQKQRAVDSQNRALGDMATDFNKMVRRSGQDLTTQMTELYGSFAGVYTATVGKINATIGKYAPGIAKDLVKEINAAQLAINTALLQTGSGDPGTSTTADRNIAAAAHQGGDHSISQALGGHAAGGISTRAHTARFSEGNRPEMMVPLDNRGLQYMTQFTNQVALAVLKTMQGRSNPLSGVAQSGTPSQTMLDNSTTYTGDIHVTADDPRAMERQLEARKRLRKLARPAGATA